LIPESVIGIFLINNPSGLTMAFGSTQPIIEMSTRNISQVLPRPVMGFLYLFTLILMEMRLLDTWDRNGSTSGPTPRQICYYLREMFQAKLAE